MPSPGVAEVARRTIARRKSLGWSQEKLAKQATISTRTVRNIERAAAHPRWQTVRLLAGALGVDGDEWIELLASDGGPPVSDGPGLPWAWEGFVGREAELSALERVSRTADVHNVAVVGTAGVGKTALAVQAAHRLADRFPGGRLFVNMRGFDGSGLPATPAEAAASLLDQLGLPPDGSWSAGTLTQRYRETVTGRRVLTVIDNVRDIEQIRPLLMDSTASVTLLTSRRALPCAVAHRRIQPMRVGLLSEHDARALLINRIGEQRVMAEPSAVDDIVRRCGRLPLALAIIAARAATRPRFTLAEIAAEMRAYRRPLDAFAGGEPTSDVRTVISWSFDALSPDAALAAREVGRRPSAEVSVAELSGMLDIDTVHALRLLGELVRAQLMRPVGIGRYAFDDLSQAYAAELTAHS